jgi:hypothetical protein
LSPKKTAPGLVRVFLDLKILSAPPPPSGG